MEIYCILVIGAEVHGLAMESTVALRAQGISDAGVGSYSLTLQVRAFEQIRRTYVGMLLLPIKCARVSSSEPSLALCRSEKWKDRIKKKMKTARENE